MSQTEAWQVAISWAANYHACKTKHAYLSGWVAGQVANPVLMKEKK